MKVLSSLVCYAALFTLASGEMMPIDVYSVFDINGIQDTGAGAVGSQFGVPGAIVTPGAGVGTATPIAGNEATKPPIYRQLPSKVASAQTLPTVTNYRFIQQPIIQQRNIDQPINQKRYMVQPVILGRTILQPLQQKIAEQTVVQPQVTKQTAIYPHVIEQPVLQKQYQQQDTYVQTYQQTHGVQPTQTQPATFTAEAPQTIKGGAPAGATTPPAAGAPADP